MLNIPISNTSEGTTPVVQNRISVAEVNHKILPAGTPPQVVYRIGDGTVHPEGWDNVDGLEYLDFYLSAGATGATGKDGGSPIYDFTYNATTGDLEYSLVGYADAPNEVLEEW